MEENIQKEINGEFNGEHMLSEDGRIYPVLANYASRSKLVEGDKLQLKIDKDKGTFYKQTGKVPRGTFPGMAVKDENGRIYVEYDGKMYKILNAVQTFYELEAGQEVFITIPIGREAEWATIETVIG